MKYFIAVACLSLTQSFICIGMQLTPQQQREQQRADQLRQAEQHRQNIAAQAALNTAQRTNTPFPSHITYTNTSSQAAANRHNNSATLRRF